MFEWLMLLLTPLVPHAEPPKKDYIGVVAAEAAYAAMRSDKEDVTPDRPIDPNCPTCHGTGKVKSGDGLGWTKCPTCQSPKPAVKTPAPQPAQQPSMRLQVKPLVPKTGACPDGNCRYMHG